MMHPGYEGFLSATAVLCFSGSHLKFNICVKRMYGGGWGGGGGGHIKEKEKQLAQ